MPRTFHQPRRRLPILRGFGTRGDHKRSLEAPKPRKPIESSSKPKDPKPPLPFNPFTATCQLAMFDTDQSVDCRGLIQRCHLVPNQWLKNTLGLDPIERWHSDFWMRGCELHHRRQELGFVVILRHQLPSGLKQRAINMAVTGDLRLEGRLDVDYNGSRFPERRTA